MDNMTLVPTPNWFLNQVMAINHDCSLVAYCVRTEIVIMKNAYATNAFGVDFRTIKGAHKDRAAGCVFSPVSDVNKPFCKHLVSFGDDGAVRMWNMANGQCVMVNNAHIKQIESGHKVVGIDWLKTDPHVIVTVSDNSVVVRWALEANTVKQYAVKARVFPQCVAASPHNKDIVAIGAKCGHVILFSMKSDHGTVLGKVRCFDNDIMCLSWCPIATDVIYDKSDSEPKYLVVGSKDYGVYIINTNHSSKVKNDCAKVIANVHLPRSAMSKHNARFGKNYKKDHGWSIVCWCGPHTIVTTTRFSEVITFQTEPLQTHKDGLQFKFKLVHDRHKSKPILCLACPQTTELDVGMDQVIWTLAVDRHLIRYSLQQLSLTLDLNTCTSYVFGLALSIVPDQSRLAIGLGEGKILVWNMVKRSYLDMTEIWQKIEGKVMSLSFHPVKEGWLGFGTSTGSVGVVDLGAPNKGPIVIYSLEKSQARDNMEHEKNAVYRLQWGPSIPARDSSSGNTDEGKEQTGKEITKEQAYCLYGTSNGQVYAFILSSKAFKATPPVALKPRLDEIDKEAGQPENTRKSDLCWKPDYSALAVANENGSIYILSPELNLLVTILEHTKLINTLAWHPGYIYTCESPNQHWLATGSDKIKVFNIDPDNLNLSQQPIATLALHSQKITCVAWNPHVNGQLLSTSYDSVAQVWDVINQTPLVSYHGHVSHVMSGLWSPLDPDLIITGSADGTVQCWRMSNQTTTRPSDKKKTKNSAETAPVATCDVTSEELTTEVKGDSVKSKDGGNSHSRNKQKSVFPITGNQLSIGSHLHVLVNRYIKTINPDSPITIVTQDDNMKALGTGDAKIVELETNLLVEKDTDAKEEVIDSVTDTANAGNDETKPDAILGEGKETKVPLVNEVHETNGHHSPEKPEAKDEPFRESKKENVKEKVSADNKKDGASVDDKDTVEKDSSALYLNFFGTREDMSSLVQAELTQHINNKYTTGALGTALWLGDFNVVVRMAMEKEELTDEIVALSQTASLKLWRECCAVYAKQLISHGLILKATNYLLAIHKVEEAVSLLLSNDLYKEALCLAKLRLPEGHEMISRGYTAWADYNASHGNYAQAAHIYLLLEDGASAMKLLNKANDIRLQYYACIIALNQSNMASTSNTMLNNCFKRSLEKVPLTFAKEMVESHPEHKHFRLWYHGRERSAQMLENTTILSTWAQPDSTGDALNIVDEIHADVKDKDVTTSDVNTLMEMITMCEGMDKSKVLLYISGHLAVASMLADPAKLKHILLSLKVAYKLQSRIMVFPALINAALYPRGPMESYSLLDPKNTSHPDYVLSLRAFFCDAIVNWLYYCVDKNLSEQKLLDILEHTLEQYVQDAINMDTVQYYKAQADLATLETSLCQQLVKDNIIKKVDSLENLSLFKSKGSKRNSRTASPNENDKEKVEIENEDKKDEDNISEGKKETGNGSDEKKNQDNENEDKKEGEKVQGEKVQTEKKKKDDESEDKEKGDGEKNCEENNEVVDEKKCEETKGEDEEDNAVNKKRLNDEDPAIGTVEKKPKLDEAVNANANGLQDFEKATNPKYDIEREPSDDEKEEEELSSEEKVQRIKELQETITKFERDRIYAPNPSHMFDLVFKVLNTFGSTESSDQARIRELVELMRTHAEAFELA